MFKASGTSGLPEVAVRWNYALISQYRGVYYEPPFHVTRLAVLPLHHLLADFWTSIFPIRYSHPVCIMRRFDAAGLQNARRFSITETYLVPTMVQILTQCSLSVGAQLATLRYVGVAGGPQTRTSCNNFKPFSLQNPTSHSYTA
ncbi:hypothetical protein IFM61392_09386 [Aspergillus lentulus]|nr:hypothetical protein IFM61392_09386 [Aspergillus lentulus]